MAEVTKITPVTDSRGTTNGLKNTTDQNEVIEIETPAEIGDVNGEAVQSVVGEQSEVENVVIKRMVIRHVKTVRQILKLIQRSHVDEVVVQEKTGIIVIMLTFCLLKLLSRILIQEIFSNCTK